MPEHHDYDFDDHPGEFRPELHRLKMDRCNYQDRIPCQVLPWLVGTNSIDLYVEQNGVYLRLIAKDVRALLESGTFLWSPRNEPLPRSATSRLGYKLGYELKVSADLNQFRPTYTTSGARPKDHPELNFTRAPVTRFNPRKDC